MSNRSRHDLAIVATASLGCLVLVLLPIWGPLQILAVAALVLFLPGYAIAAAVFPQATLGRGERLVYSFVLSIAAAGLGGFVYQLAFDLSRLAWTLVIVSITQLACLIARWRITHSALTADRGSRMPPRALATMAAVLAAVALAIVAVAVATQGVHSQRARSHFSALWIAADTAGTETVEVAVENHQDGVHEYALDLAIDGRTVRRWQGRLGAHQGQSLTMSERRLPASGQLVASLYKDGVMYRRTELRIARAN